MKAEQYIEDCTQKGSNVLCTTEDRYGIKEISYYDWLTPSQALEAVKLAREEIYKWLMKNAAKYYPETDLDFHRTECMLEKLQMFVSSKNEYTKTYIDVK